MADPLGRENRTSEPTVGITVRHLDPAEFRDRSAELLQVYVAAMRYPTGTGQARSMLWYEHSNRPGFDCVAAIDETGTARGLAYGYRGLPGQWWYNEVRRGVLDATDPTAAGSDRLTGTAEPPTGAGKLLWLNDYLELTELHVRPDSQGGGLGERLLRALVTGRSEASVLLSTPEGTNRAWRLYRRLGFQDVLRDFRFTGDPRPFGVLGRRLPLDPAGAGAPAGH